MIGILRACYAGTEFPEPPKISQSIGPQSGGGSAAPRALVCVATPVVPAVANPPPLPPPDQDFTSRVSDVPTETAPPRIVLICLKHRECFDERYESVLSKLRLKAKVQRTKKPQSAIRVLSEHPAPSATIITDEALANASDYAQVWEAVLQYSGLRWENGSYRRAALTLKPSVVGLDLAKKLPSRYGPKALNVRNVAHGDIWYYTDEISAVEDLGLDDMGETPVAFARIGNGRLGYVRDVNAEDSDNIILAMCGVL